MDRLKIEPDETLCELSVVIPVLNEAENLPILFDRLYPVLDETGLDYEVVFVDDGSTDFSSNLLAEQHKFRSKVTRVITFSRNFGQHMAIVAAFARSKGKIVLTLDADLQNPPEEIPKLLEMMRKGHDYVGSFRIDRQDSWFRRWASKVTNQLRSWVTRIEMRDQGCMMRAYSRDIAKAIARNDTTYTFVPAIGFQLADHPTEIAVLHEERFSGKSNYSLYRLIRLNFDLLASCTTVPPQRFTIATHACAGLGFILVVLLAGWRLVIGPEGGGSINLLGVLFLLVSLVMVGVGLIGECLGKTSLSNRVRANYKIKSILEDESCKGNQKYCSLDTVK